MTPEALTRFREERGLTRRAFAATLGIADKTLRGYERGGRIPRYIALACAALAFGLPPYGEHERLQAERQ